MVKGVVGPGIPPDFAVPAACGDLVPVAMAWLTLALRKTNLFQAALWLFNLWGTTDLLFAFFQGLYGVRIEAGALGSTFFIPTVYVPLLLCTHVIVFGLLARGGR